MRSAPRLCHWFRSQRCSRRSESASSHSRVLSNLSTATIPHAYFRPADKPIGAQTAPAGAHVLYLCLAGRDADCAGCSSADRGSVQVRIAQKPPAAGNRRTAPSRDRTEPGLGLHPLLNCPLSRGAAPRMDAGRIATCCDTIEPSGLSARLLLTRWGGQSGRSAAW